MSKTSGAAGSHGVSSSGASFPCMFHEPTKMRASHGPALLSPDRLLETDVVGAAEALSVALLAGVSLVPAGATPFVATGASVLAAVSLGATRDEAAPPAVGGGSERLSDTPARGETGGRTGMGSEVTFRRDGGRARGAARL